MRTRILSTAAARLATLALMLTPLFPPGFAAAHAQSAVSPSPVMAPAAAATQPTTPVFRSAFEGYQPYTEQKMAPWKEANDNVGQIGGWREYAREASQPDTAEKAAAPVKAAKPAEPANPKAGGPKP